jgi:hypothetical protein
MTITRADIAARLRRAVRRELWAASWRGVRIASILRWLISPYRASSRCAGAKRVLVYDFSRQPISVGDLLVARVAAECLRIRDGATRVDVALLCEAPVDASPGAGSSVEDMGRFLQGVRLDPDLGSVMLFWRRCDLEEYLDRLPLDTVPWPPAGYYASGQYVCYLVWNELLHDCYHLHHQVPVLRAPPGASQWAATFVAQHAAGRHAISVQLRRNPLNPARNSDFDAWLAFFEACATRGDPYVFFVIGCESEADGRLSACSNVVVAKAHHTSLDQDLALVGACAAHMGASSGPSTMAFFSPKPYVLFGWNTADYRYRELEVDTGLRRFYFASPAQRLLPGRETMLMIDSEFQRLRAVIEAPPAHLPDEGAGVTLTRARSDARGGTLRVRSSE